MRKAARRTMEKPVVKVGSRRRLLQHHARVSLDVNVMSRDGVRAPRALTLMCMAKVVRALSANGSHKPFKNAAHGSSSNSKNSKSVPSFTLSSKALRQFSSAEEISVMFVSSRQIRRLNREFRGKDKATDILSFAAVEDGSLGELVIALDVIRAQAGEHALSLRDELTYMLLHGVLHLLGYDHESSASGARKMFAIQDGVFEMIRD